MLFNETEKEMLEVLLEVASDELSNNSCISDLMQSKAVALSCPVNQSCAAMAMI